MYFIFALVSIVSNYIVNCDNVNGNYFRVREDSAHAEHRDGNKPTAWEEDRDCA